MDDASLVTGGGRGIGRTIALRLSGLRPVVVVGRTEADLQAVCDEIRQKGGEAIACPGDVRHVESAERAVEMANLRGWRVANLVCNAGIGKSGPTSSFGVEDWEEIFNINVHGAFRFVRACLPGMLEHKSGAICLISSIAGLKGLSHDAAYSSSKHALVGLARSLALEVGKKGVIVVPICPGFVESEMTERSIQSLMRRRSLSRENAVARIAATNSHGRIIQAEEVAETVAMVCERTLPSLNGNPVVLGGLG